MDVAADVTELIGETPLLSVDSFAPNLLVKLESFNPYSVKDRIGREMIAAAEDAGEITDETVVVEPTSGNTGIGLAAVCAAKGHDLVLTMPESMSEERQQLLSALGADIELTADGGMNGAIERAEELCDAFDDAFMPQQFQNPANARAHERTTGPELWDATDGEIDAFVAGVGTGGTITGTGTYLQTEVDADVDLIAVEPAESAVLSGEPAGSHSIQGIGAGFIPEILQTELLDEVRTVEKDDAEAAARKLARTEGVLGGISTGANLHVAATVARERPDETVVTVVCDPGERYLSTGLYNE